MRLPKKWLLILSAMVLIAFSMLWGVRGSLRPVAPRPICFIIKDLGQEYWETVRKGAFSAAKEFQETLLFYWVGNDSDVRGQITFLNLALKKRVQAVVLASCDMNAVVPKIKQLTKADIPVITIDSRVNSSLPVSLIATDNVRAGAKAAKVLVDLLHGQGEIAIISHVPGTATAIEREQGFRKEISYHQGIHIVPTRFSYGDPDRAETITTNIIETYPHLDGLFAVNEPAAVGAAQALILSKRSKFIRLVGFDSSIQEISFLESGVIDATVVQNPFTMGYLGVRTAFEIAQHKEVPLWIDTGSKVITRQNVYAEENQKLLFPFDPQ